MYTNNRTAKTAFSMFFLRSISSGIRFCSSVIPARCISRLINPSTQSSSDMANSGSKSSACTILPVTVSSAAGAWITVSAAVCTFSSIDKVIPIPLFSLLFYCASHLFRLQRTTILFHFAILSFNIQSLTGSHKLYQIH